MSKYPAEMPPAPFDVFYARNLDLEAISKRLHHPDGPHMQDVETILYALHSLRDDGVTQAPHDDHRQNRTGG